MHTDKLFTGQQREPDSGSVLAPYNYGARFYSALTGRFFSPDPLIAAPGDPQMLNRYSYVRSNPLVYVDPTGLCFTVAGYTYDCNPELMLFWWETALNCNNQFCDLARWGIQQQEFWDNFAELVPTSETLLGDMLAGFMGAARSSAASWDLVPDFGWQAFGEVFQVSPGFFEASLWALTFGDTTRMAALPQADIIGANWWWCDLSWATGSGDIHELIGRKTLEKVHAAAGPENFERASSAFRAATLIAAYRLGADSVNNVYREWSDTQRIILSMDVNGGFHPPPPPPERNAPSPFDIIDWIFPNPL